MKSFKDRTAVITGAASGIGFEVARQLAQQHCQLVLADVESDALERARNSLSESGARVIAQTTDVRDRDQIVALADAAEAAFGTVDVVMHNAGVAVFGPIQEMSHADWAWLMEVNLWGPIHGVEVFSPRMIAAGEGGHMVFTASFAGLVPNRELGPYNVTKAAVIALAESVAKDLREHQIGASVLCPMRVASNIDHSNRNRPNSLGGRDANRTYTQEELDGLQGRMLDVEPVASLVLDAIRDNQLYIHTHKEAQGWFDKRAARISACFENAL